MSQSDLPRARYHTASCHCNLRHGMMRGTKRALSVHQSIHIALPADRINLHHLGLFLLRHGWKYRRKSRRNQTFSSPRRAVHQEIMHSRHSNFTGSANHFLTMDISKIQYPFRRRHLRPFYFLFWDAALLKIVSCLL